MVGNTLLNENILTPERYRLNLHGSKTRPQLILSELTPGQYISTTARIAYVRTSERTDALCTKVVCTGIMEDATSKIPL
ncbi:MAG: hypothetical protein WA667_27665 [Candidatus Nitrosopolaris sp.]